MGSQYSLVGLACALSSIFCPNLSPVNIKYFIDLLIQILHVRVTTFKGRTSSILCLPYQYIKGLNKCTSLNTLDPLLLLFCTKYINNNYETASNLHAFHLYCL